MVNVAVIGTAGYAAKELIELLSGHPEAEIVTLVSESSLEGTDVGDIWPRFRGQLEIATTQRTDVSCDVAILAKPTGAAQKHTQRLNEDGVRIIDLSASFRLKDVTVYESTYNERHLCPDLIPDAAYGLTEFHRDEIAKARLVANPGCYPVSAILACAPLFTRKLVDPNDVIVDSYTGVSGAGRNVGDETYLYVERDENITPYKVLEHRHAPEMEQELGILSGQDVVAAFVPHLAPMARGIMTSVYLKPAAPSRVNLAQLRELYQSAYFDEPFVRLMPEGEPPSVANVVGTNFCDIGLFYSDRHGRIVVQSALDNLVKGAAGQAIQNMNVMFGLDETAGLLQTAKRGATAPPVSDRPILA